MSPAAAGRQSDQRRTDSDVLSGTGCQSSPPLALSGGDKSVLQSAHLDRSAHAKASAIFASGTIHSPFI